MSRNKVPASVPTAPYTVTEGVFRVAASTEYYTYEWENNKRGLSKMTYNLGICLE